MPGRLSRLCAGAAALAAVLSTPACSLSVWSTERQCETDGDCARRGSVFTSTTCESGVCTASAPGGGAGSGAGGGAVDPAWACLQGGRGGAGGGAGGGTVRVTFRGVRLDEAEPLVGASVRPCRKNDVECTLFGVEPQLTDERGEATFELPSGFDGYFEGKRDDIYDVLLFAGAITRDIALPSVGGVTPTEASLLANFVLGPEGGPDGAAILSVNDCLGVPAPGVSFTAETDAAATPFFLVDGAPSAAARETDRGGRGGFLGLPEPAFLLFGAKLAATGEAVAAESAFVRNDAFTYVLLAPAP